MCSQKKKEQRKKKKKEKRKKKKEKRKEKKRKEKKRKEKKRKEKRITSAVSSKWACMLPQLSAECTMARRICLRS